MAKKKKKAAPRRASSRTKAKARVVTHPPAKPAKVTGKKVKIKGADWSPLVCGKLEALAEQRMLAKARLGELIQTRDFIDKAIKEMGHEPTQKRLKAANDLVDTLNEIILQRERIKWFSDQTERTILGANQKQLHEDDELVIPDEQSLLPFKEDKPEKPKKAKGRKAPDPEPQPEGVDQHLEAAVGELGLPKNLTELLVEKNLTTVGALVQRMDAGDDAVIELRELLGVSGGEWAEIAGAVKDFRKRHRKAAREVEQDQLQPA